MLYGHLEQLARMNDAGHEILLLHHPAEDISRLSTLQGIRPLLAPASTRKWYARAAWETASLPALMRRERANVYFTPSGTILPRSPIPQASMAPNPWCLVPGMQQTFIDHCKAAIQRSAYRRAFRRADLMLYISEHLRGLYRKNAGDGPECPHLIAYCGIDEETFVSAQSMRGKVTKQPLTVLVVSVMAHWKGAEVVVDAVHRLHQQAVPAQLRLVGPWAEPEYRTRIESLIRELNLGEFVTITGGVSKEELHAEYARASVYCLMSRCESFGIPAVEAQAFGTPVVGSNVCAMEEVCGAGGECTSPDNSQEVARLLKRLLTDENHWQLMSQRAVANAERFHWSECSKPLKALFAMA